MNDNAKILKIKHSFKYALKQDPRAQTFTETGIKYLGMYQTQIEKISLNF